MKSHWCLTSSCDSYYHHYHSAVVLVLLSSPCILQIVLVDIVISAYKQSSNLAVWHILFNMFKKCSTSTFWYFEFYNFNIFCITIETLYLVGDGQCCSAAEQTKNNGSIVILKIFSCMH